ncbi:MAG: AbrB/MazE/SpoVT family DNA-binding domain-containing protein [Solirubrobacterales bacterium]
MRATIDKAGRLVVPKPIRDELGLEAGVELELTARDGRLEASVPPTPMRLDDRADGVVAVADRELPSLTVEQVRETLERVRR